MNSQKSGKQLKALEKRSRKRLRDQLGHEMSRISKECYYAEWLRNSEYVVPELCRRALQDMEAQPWGCGEVTPERAARLVALAAELGHWVSYDFRSQKFQPFNPFPVPELFLSSLVHQDRLREEACKNWSLLLRSEGLHAN